MGVLLIVIEFFVIFIGIMKLIKTILARIFESGAKRDDRIHDENDWMNALIKEGLSLREFLDVYFLNFIYELLSVLESEKF